MKQRDFDLRTFTQESFILFNNNHHKFYKFLNLFIFIDKNVELIWDSWRIKIDDKLKANADHFHTENICIVYVVSRLEDDAAKQMFAWCHHDASHSYTTIYELFKYLKFIYDNQDKN